MKRRFAIPLLALLAVLAGADAWAHGGRYYPRSSVQFGLFFGDPWPYYYPGPVYWPRVYVPPLAPVIVTPPPIYIEQAPAAPQVAGTLEPGYWYYCGEAQAYYPYVKECPGGWQKVAPAPAK